MRICITGGLGVIGSWITRSLIQKGMRPVVISRTNDFSLVPDCDGKFDFLACDIQDAAAINSIFRREKFEGLIHAAAMGNIGTTEQYPVQSINVNCIGTAVVIEAAATQNVKTVIYVSSGSVYEVSDTPAQHDTQTIDEDFPVRPKHISKLTKWFGEEIGRYFAQRHGFQFAAIRSTSMYAPVKQSHKTHVPIHSRLIENAARGIPTRLSRHEAKRVGDWIYVADLAEGVVSACLSQQLNHDVYNLGSGQAITVREFAEAVCKVFPSASIEIASEYDDSGKDAKGDRIFDISRARKDLNFQPRYDATSGIADYKRMLDIFNS